MSEKEYEKDTQSDNGFSWTAEKKAALDGYNRNSSKQGYASSIFTKMGDTPRQENNRRNTGYVGSSGNFRYDYPSDDDYIYQPVYHASSSRSQSQIFSDMPQRPVRNQQQNKYEKNRNERQRNSDSRSIQAQQARKQQPRSTQQKASKNNRNTPNNAGKYNSDLNGHKKGGSAERHTVKKQETPNKNGRKMPKNTAQSKKMQSRQSYEAQKNRELERQRRENKRIEKNNREFEQAGSKGLSNDETRLKQMRRKKRSRKFYAVICVVAVIIIALCAGLGYCVFYGAPISNINIENSNIYEKEKILQCADINIGDNMLLIRNSKTSKTVSTALPYIESIKVKYEFPDTLKLIVTETQDRIQIELGNDIISVDANNKVLSKTKKKLKSGMYKIVGLKKQEYSVGEIFVPVSEADENEYKTDTNKNKYEIAKEIISAIEENGIKNCSVIDVSNLSRISISCGKSLTIFADSKTPFSKRFATAKQEIESRENYGNKPYADLRFSDMVVFGDGEPS